MAGEFELIRRYAPAGKQRVDVLLGSGDDAAVLAVPSDRQLVITVDTLVAGRHFPLETPAADVGWKSLAVNLSDLAAMGAEAAWATIALTLPANHEDPESWMAAFAEGVQCLAQAHGVAIVGGDLTAGPLSITIQAMGLVEPGRAMQRDTAIPGDVIAVTGDLGGAAGALQLLQAGVDVPAALTERLNRPVPRLAQGQRLAAVAHAGIDLSDGLVADLGHILKASGVGAKVYAEALPLNETLLSVLPLQAQSLALGGGDDYELCVCLPPDAVSEVQACLDSPLTVIGEIMAGSGLAVIDVDGSSLDIARPGYDHFHHKPE